MSADPLQEVPTGAVLIIGATGGIGQALVRSLAGNGVQLWLTGRDEARLQAVSDEVGAHAVPCDARDWQALEEVAAMAAAGSGRLEGIVNLAGSLLLKPAHLTTAQEWQDIVSTNLTTAFGAIRAGAKTMTGGGSIVLVSSAAARVGIANHEAIAAAKAGVLGLTLSAAATYAPRGLRVNAVAPGLVDTPMTARIVANESSRKASESMHALGRIGSPEAVASAIAWLLAPGQDWVTGQVIGVDGGLGSVLARARG